MDLNASCGHALDERVDDLDAKVSVVTAVLQDLDLALGFSTSGDETLGKLSVGFSFP
jgi:hypothetical protein